MNPTSVDVVSILVSESDLDLVFPENLFIGKEPALPSNSVTVFDTPGQPPSLTLSGNAEQGYFYPSIQIRVRNTDYLTGWALADAIKNCLHGRNNEVWGGTTYLVIKCIQGPFLLDWDEKGRARFIVSFDIERKP